MKPLYTLLDWTLQKQKACVNPYIFCWSIKFSECVYTRAPAAHLSARKSKDINFLKKGLMKCCQVNHIPGQWPTMAYYTQTAGATAVRGHGGQMHDKVMACRTLMSPNKVFSQGRSIFVCHIQPKQLWFLWFMPTLGVCIPCSKAISWHRLAHTAGCIL